MGFEPGDPEAIGKIFRGYLEGGEYIELLPPR
jgi:hypothetical protein